MWKCKFHKCPDTVQIFDLCCESLNAAEHQYFRQKIEYKQKRSPVVARVRPTVLWRSSKVNDFHFIWKCVCYFLLVINSNLGRISHHFRDMASFPSKNAHFSYPPSFNTQFKNVPFGVDGWSLTPMANYSCERFPPMPYPLAAIHPLQTDRQMDDNHSKSLTFGKKL